MSKIGLTIAAGLVVATGLWGMTHLDAFQDAVVATTPTDEPAPESPAAKPRRPLTGAAAEFSRRSERDAERRLNELMQTERVANLEFPGENPLTDILETLSVTLSESQESPIVIRPDVMELNNDSIVLSDVIIRDIMIPEGLMTVGSALDHVLSQTDPALTWIAKDELLLITTMSAAEADENMFLRSYDISQLREISQLTVSTWDSDGAPQGGGGGFFSVVFEPSQFGGGGMGGGGIAPATPRKKKTRPSKPQPEESMTQQAKQEAVITWEAGLIRTIQDLTGPPCHWFEIDGEGGKLSIAGNRLIVRQSRKGHEQVVAVLEQLEMAADDAVKEQ